ncbi:MAG TPA: translation initiation factor IF-2 N-terminal domain-containing protein, partial [Vicinamibacterales bacterium]
MATVRIYKIAELLNTTSQEVIALLKRDHDIEVKSASSTVEEVVAREFVSRIARQRNLNVPSNVSFTDSPAPSRGRKQGGKPVEPPKPPTPQLKPRLVKTAKPVMPTPPADEQPEPPPAPETVLVRPPAPAPEPPAPPAPAPVAETPAVPE